MKKISLRIPLYWEEDPRISFKKPVWLKVGENEIEPYMDRALEKKIEIFNQSITIDALVPDELELVEVVCPGMATPVDMVEAFWNIAMADKNWRIAGLKEICLIFNDGMKKINVINERPDMEDWKEYTTEDNVGSYLWTRPWILTTYATEYGTYGVLFWKEIMKLKGKLN